MERFNGCQWPWIISEWFMGIFGFCSSSFTGTHLIPPLSVNELFLDLGGYILDYCFANQLDLPYLYDTLSLVYLNDFKHAKSIQGEFVSASSGCVCNNAGEKKGIPHTSFWGTFLANKSHFKNIITSEDGGKSMLLKLMLVPE